MALYFSTVMNNIFHNVSDIRGRDIRLINVPQAAQAAVQPYLNASAEDLAAIQEMEAQASKPSQSLPPKLHIRPIPSAPPLESDCGFRVSSQATVQPYLNASAEDLAAIQEMEAQAALVRARKVLITSQATLGRAQKMSASIHATLDRSQATLERFWAIPASSQMVTATAPHQAYLANTSTKMQNTHLCRPEPARVSGDSEEKIREFRLAYLANHQPHQQMHLIRIEVGEASIAYTKAQSRHTELRQELRELKMAETKLPPSVKAQWALLCREKEREVNVAAQEENHQQQLLNKIRGL